MHLFRDRELAVSFLGRLGPPDKLTQGSINEFRLGRVQEFVLERGHFCVPL